MAKYIVGKVKKRRFRKKKHALPAKEDCKKNRENDHASFNRINDLIGYQNLADFCEIWPE